MNELVNAMINEQVVSIEKTDRSNLIVCTTVQFGDQEAKLTIRL